MSDDVQRIKDILESIHNIERYATRGRGEFESDELIFTWIVHHLIIIGEAAGRVSATTQADAVSVPWRDIVAMRNILVHQYSHVDAETVWRVVVEDLPVLKSNLEHLVDKLGRNE